VKDVMGSDDTGPCFIVIGIILIVFDFVMFYTLYFTLLGVFFICMGCAASHKKLHPTPKYSQPTYQQTAPQQTTQPINQITQPIYQQPTPEVRKIEKAIEKHQFCPYCGAIANGDYCAECGEKID
jgi:hypothetical protein